MSGTWDRLRSLFEEGLERPPEERTAWLETVCPNDPVLREEVLALWAHDEAPASIFGSTPDRLAAAAEHPDERVEGLTLGAYRLVREIGRGGMGAVYLAERSDVGLRAAVKVVRGGFGGWASREHVRRFLLERRLLARLEHPFIARLLDGGITSDGTHWLALELVDGEPITTFCEREGLGLEARLDLFIDVCEAVSFAHRNLIVHRDLKPGNIFVSDAGGTASPKLLDFGIAKLLGADVGDDGGLTRTGGFAMTPEYAAPEQVSGDPVTTATDVYALGMVLYEILAGCRAYEFDWGAPAEAIRTIREYRPQPPSQAPETGSGVPRREVAGDLDRVVLKALEKAPPDRYESAAALATDLRRFRQGLPVTAQRPTVGYRARKFVRRNRPWIAAAAVVLVSLLGGLGSAVWQLGEAQRERARAEEALAASEEVRGFLFDLFDASRPNIGRETPHTLRELLEQGSRQAEQLAGQPLVQARVLEEIGKVYSEQGEYHRADSTFDRVVEIRTRVLGRSTLPVARALSLRGDVALRLTRYDRADSLFRSALRVHDDHPDEAGPGRAAAVSGLARVHTYRGDYEASLDRFRQALEIRRATFGTEHMEVAEGVRLVAVTLRRLGRQDEATARYEEALDIARRAEGRRSVDAARTMIHLADQYAVHNGEPGRAEALLLEGLGILRDHLGSRDPELVHGLHSLAQLRLAQGDTAASDALFGEALDITGQAYGKGSPLYAVRLARAGTRLAERGELDEAEALQRTARAILDSIHRPGHRLPLSARADLARTLLLRGEAARAVEEYRAILALRQEVEGQDSYMVAGDLERLGLALTAAGDYAEAERTLLKALRIYGTKVSDEHVAVRRTTTALIRVYEAMGRTAEAEAYRSRA